MQARPIGRACCCPETLVPPCLRSPPQAARSRPPVPCAATPGPRHPARRPAQLVV